MKFLLAVLLLGGAAYATDCPVGQAKDGSVLIQMERSWARALEQRDAATLGCILADEFQDVGAGGKLTDRATTLAKAGTPSPGLAPHHELSELQPQVQGEFGYIRGMATAVDAQGKVLARVRFTDVYVYRNGRWQCVAGQETMIKEPEK
jgi:hypothetical protein